MNFYFSISQFLNLYLNALNNVAIIAAIEVMVEAIVTVCAMFDPFLSGLLGTMISHPGSIFAPPKREWHHLQVSL